MREVETHTLFVHQLACLLDMCAEHFPQRRLQQVCSRMVARDGCTALFVGRCFYSFSDVYCAGFDFRMVQEIFCMVFSSIRDGNNGIFRFDYARIAHLAAAFAVKRCLVKQKHGIVTCCSRIGALAVFDNGNYFCFRLRRSIAEKFCFKCVLQQPAFSGPCISSGILARGAGTLFLFKH